METLNGINHSEDQSKIVKIENKDKYYNNSGPSGAVIHTAVDRDGPNIIIIIFVKILVCVCLRIVRFYLRALLWSSQTFF